MTAHNVTVNRRLGQLKPRSRKRQRDRTDTALSAIEAQRRARAGFASQRNEAAATLAALNAERAPVVPRPADRVEAAPIRYVAEADRHPHRQRARNPVAYRFDGAVPQPVGNRDDGSGFGAAIHCLKPHLVRSTSITVVRRRSRPQQLMNGLVQHTIMQCYSITSSARGAPSRPACALLSFRLHDARADR